jgi:hypothetical protein
MFEKTVYQDVRWILGERVLIGFHEEYRRAGCILVCA